MPGRLSAAEQPADWAHAVRANQYRDLRAAAVSASVLAGSGNGPTGSVTAQWNLSPPSATLICRSCHGI